MSTSEPDSRQSNNRFIYTVLIAILVVNAAIIGIAQLTYTPDPADQFAQAAVAAQERGDYDVAIVSYTEALSYDAENPRIFYNRGVAHWQYGNLDRAIADLEQAIALDARYAWPHLALGDIYMAQGAEDRALAHFTIFRELSAGDANALATADQRLEPFATQLIDQTTAETAANGAIPDGSVD